MSLLALREPLFDVSWQDHLHWVPCLAEHTDPTYLRDWAVRVCSLTMPRQEVTFPPEPYHASLLLFCLFRGALLVGLVERPEIGIERVYPNVETLYPIAQREVQDCLEVEDREAVLVREALKLVR